VKVRRLALVLAAAVVGAAALGCSEPNPKPEVAITVDEFSLTISPTSADEGSVKMFLENEGEIAHGLVFARARDVKELPLAPDGSVDLTKTQVADRLEPVAPGSYRIQPDLFPGPLVVFCNLVTKGPDGKPVSHFQAGMVATLEIEATSTAELPTP
jgi:hypothetical protein